MSVLFGWGVSEAAAESCVVYGMGCGKRWFRVKGRGWPSGEMWQGDSLLGLILYVCAVWVGCVGSDCWGCALFGRDVSEIAAESCVVFWIGWGKRWFRVKGKGWPSGEIR